MSNKPVEQWSEEDWRKFTDENQGDFCKNPFPPKTEEIKTVLKEEGVLDITNLKGLSINDVEKYSKFKCGRFLISGDRIYEEYTHCFNGRKSTMTKAIIPYKDIRFKLQEAALKSFAYRSVEDKYNLCRLLQVLNKAYNFI